MTTFFSRIFLAFMALAVGASGFVSGQQAKLNSLLGSSPGRANSMAYYNVPVLKKLMADAGMPAMLSADVQEVWMVAELDTVELVPHWEAGYATLTNGGSVDRIVEKTQGYLDRVASKDVIWTPQQLYLVPLNPRELGFLRPANRSLLSDWLGSKQPARESAYLRESAKQPEDYLSLLVAIDLRDRFSPLALTNRLADFQSLANVDKASIAQTLASVQGLRILVGRRSLSECILSIEFANAPNDLEQVATRLLDEVLSRNGTAAPEVLKWQTKVQGNSLSFQGPISAQSLDGVLGIFTLGDQAEQVAGSLATEERPKLASNDMAYATKKFFDRVNRTIEDVRDFKAITTGQRAKWNDQKARKLDELPTLGVDPEMVQYGVQIATMLRSNSLSTNTTNISAGQMKASQTGSYYNYNGFHDPNATVSQRVTDAQATGAVYTDFRTTLAKIDQMTADMRRAMTDKYKIQF